MPRIKQHEAIVYRAVKAGELEIDRQGRVWRVNRRVWNERGKRFMAVPCIRRRAEHRAGPLLNVRAKFNGRSYATSASRLVWLHFKGAIPAGLQVKHRNGREDDNRLQRVAFGEKHHCAKLTDKGVRRMRAARKRGEPLASLARKNGVSVSTVLRACNGEQWRHVGRR
jgi:hypothetical protein